MMKTTEKQSSQHLRVQLFVIERLPIFRRLVIYFLHEKFKRIRSNTVCEFVGERGKNRKAAMQTPLYVHCGCKR